MPYRIFSKIIFFAFFLLFVNTAESLSVPFENINQAPNVTIQASYSFGQFPLIFCYENNQQTTGVVTWTFQGSLKQSTLPLVLTNNPLYEGQFADPNGVITIRNNSAGPYITNCYLVF